MGNSNKVQIINEMSDYVGKYNVGEFIKGTIVGGELSNVKHSIYYWDSDMPGNCRWGTELGYYEKDKLFVYQMYLRIIEGGKVEDVITGEVFETSNTKYGYIPSRPRPLIYIERYISKKDVADSMAKLTDEDISCYKAMMAAFLEQLETNYKKIKEAESKTDSTIDAFCKKFRQ